jgi:S-DNA-T family DNA segregation ATPase FtsK/SpoIIIE
MVSPGRYRPRGRTVVPMHPEDADPDETEAPEAAAPEAAEPEEPEPAESGVVLPKLPKPDPGDPAEQRRAKIIPDHFSREQRWQTLKDFAELTAYRAKYHGVRAPFVYTPGSVMYAGRGAGRLTYRWGRWVSAWELKVLELAAVARVTKGETAAHRDAVQAHKDGKKTRKERWGITGGVLVGAGIASALIAEWVPWEGQYAIAMTAYGTVAYLGRPKSGPLIPRAILPSTHQPPTLEIITQAFDDLGIPKLTAYIKDKKTLEWVIDLHPDGDGWGVELDLPKGVKAEQIIQKRKELSSALRRPLSAVWPEAVPGEHEGRLYLWIGRRDLAKRKPIPHPNLKSGVTDVFSWVPFGELPRGTKITAPLFQANWLIGGAMGNGKTGTLRTLVTAIALDVVCDLWIHEHSGKGDLKAFADVSHRYCSGLDDEAIAYTYESMKLLRAELVKRQKIFREVPDDEKSDGGALTRQMAEKDKRLRPIGVIVDEVHNALRHPLYGEKIAADMEFIMRVGRAYGIFFIIASQRPGADSIPVPITAVIVIRCCHKVNDQGTADMILGTGSYKQGYNPVEFRHETDAGLCWLRGHGDPVAPKVYFVSLAHSKQIARRARGLRERAGVLSGYAVGLDDGDEPRDLLQDVLSLYGPKEKHLYWETIAKRLAERYPAYASITRDAASSQIREAAGMGESDEAREPRGPNRAGAKKLTIETAATSSAAVRSAAAPDDDGAQDSAPPPYDVELAVAAAELIIREQWASTTTIGRKLRIGFKDTCDLLTALQAIGVVGPAEEGSKTRPVLVQPDQLEETLARIRETVDAPA